jgi:hypothetical protein
MGYILFIYWTACENYGFNHFNYDFLIEIEDIFMLQQL